jgi:hypothetical protein
MMDSVQQPKDAATTLRLMDLIDNMSEDQRQALLDMLEDWQFTKRRKHPRKSWVAPVDYTVEDRAFKDFIKNISAGGVFIETRTPFSVGQEISMSFSFTTFDDPIKTKGKIFWANILGIGVKFSTENQALVAMLETL